MNRRFLQRCLLWLLPLLVAQTLVPAGFMLSGGANGLQIAFCPVQSAPLVAAFGKPAGVDHSKHVAHAVHSATDPVQLQHDSNAAQTVMSCAYALAATAIAPVEPFIVAATFVQIGRVATVPSAAPPTISPFDRNRIRGPPTLS